MSTICFGCRQLIYESKGFVEIAYFGYTEKLGLYIQKKDFWHRDCFELMLRKNLHYDIPLNYFNILYQRFFENGKY